MGLSDALAMQQTVSLSHRVLMLVGSSMEPKEADFFGKPISRAVVTQKARRLDT
jgi:hypothetical protein